MTKKIFVLLLLFNIISFYSYSCEKKRIKAIKDYSKLNFSIIEWIRFSLEIPADVEIKVGDAVPSEIEWLKKVDVTFSRGGQSRVDTYYFTDDGKYLFLGRFVDLTKDPKKEVLSKISFDNQVEKGNKDANVIIVKYSDFQCVFCSRVNETLENILKEYNGKVRLIFKHFPLNFRQWATDAAIASQCAWEQKKESFWKFSEYFYKNQRDIKEENLKDRIIELAKNERLDIKEFETCFVNKMPLDKVKRDVEEARRLNITSIPTIIINGTIIRGAQPIEKFRAIIDAEILSK